MRYAPSLSDDQIFTLFLTGAQNAHHLERFPKNVRYNRITKSDLAEAVGSVQSRNRTVVYVCGPQAMTDEVVDFLKGLPGMDRGKVLCEKWW